jgi:hypothetical protein
VIQKEKKQKKKKARKKMCEWVGYYYILNIFKFMTVSFFPPLTLVSSCNVHLCRFAGLPGVVLGDLDKIRDTVSGSSEGIVYLFEISLYLVNSI